MHLRVCFGNPEEKGYDENNMKTKKFDEFILKLAEYDYL